MIPFPFLLVFVHLLEYAKTITFYLEWRTRLILLDTILVPYVEKRPIFSPLLSLTYQHKSPPQIQNIPNWDILIIPKWYNKVKRFSKNNFEKGEKMEFRLKELRKTRNISQLKLALDLNMNQNSISRYENCEREADYETLIKFAEYFDVSLDYLLGRTDNPQINN